MENLLEDAPDPIDWVGDAERELIIEYRLLAKGGVPSDSITLEAYQSKAHRIRTDMVNFRSGLHFQWSMAKNQLSHYVSVMLKSGEYDDTPKYAREDLFFGDSQYMDLRITSQKLEALYSMIDSYLWCMKDMIKSSNTKIGRGE